MKICLSLLVVLFAIPTFAKTGKTGTRTPAQTRTGCDATVEKIVRALDPAIGNSAIDDSGQNGVELSLQPAQKDGHIRYVVNVGYVAVDGQVPMESHYTVTMDGSNQHCDFITVTLANH